MKKMFILFSLVFISHSLWSNEWLKGDLHLHTNAGKNADSTASEILQFAHNSGLDFAAITEHDCKINGVPNFWKELKANKSKTIPIYGMEWTHGTSPTNSHGHMNLWSSKPFDYSKFWEANLNDDGAAAIDEAIEQDILYSINHPSLPGYTWEYAYPENLPSMEIWSTVAVYSRSQKTINDQWQNYYRQGKRVTGVGGSDTHKFKKENPLYTMGTPTTWVYAKKRNANAVLEGIRNGRVLISFSPFAPVPLLSINKAIVGDNLIVSKGKNLNIHIESLNNQNEKGKIEELTLYKNGMPFKSWKLSSNKFSINVLDKADGERAWYYVILSGDTGYEGLKKILHGNMISLSNPITLNF